MNAFLRMSLLLTGFFLMQSGIYAQSISGVYKGRYECDNTKLDFELRLNHQKNDLVRGEMTIYRPDYSSKDPSGIAIIRGVFNPQNKSLMLYADDWKKHGPFGSSFRQMQTTFYPKSKTITVDSKYKCPPFDLTQDRRETQKWRNVLEKENAAWEEVPLSLAKAKGVKGRSQTLLKWAQVLENKHPELFSKNRIFTDDLRTKSYILFSEPIFSNVFGKPLQQLSKKEREKYDKIIQECYRDRNYGSEFTWQRRILDFPFSRDEGKYSYQEMVAKVSSMPKAESRAQAQTNPQLNDQLKGQLAEDLARVKAIPNPDPADRDGIIEQIDQLIIIKKKVQNEYRPLETEGATLEKYVQEKLDLIRQVVGPGWQPAPTGKRALLEYRLGQTSRQSAFAYFRLDSRQEESDFNLKADYQYLREVIFRPAYKSQMKKRGEPEFKPGQPVPSMPLRPVEAEERVFSNFVLHRLYIGDFADLKEQSRESYSGGKQPDFYWIVSAYVGIANRHCGKDQINGATQMQWVSSDQKAWNGIVTQETIHEGEPFWIDNKLVPIYSVSARAQWFSVITRGSRAVERAKDIYDELDRFFTREPCGSNRIRQLLENIIHYSADRKSVQEQYADWEALRYDDRFFNPAMYDRLNSFSTTRGYDGTLIGPAYTGQTLSRQQLGSLALEKLVQAAAKLGIPEKDITRAIFEGRFNPHFEDLQLAHEGLCPKITPDDIPLSVILQAKERGEMAIGQTVPSGSNIGLLASIRNQRWNERFGAFSTFENVKTVVNGKVRPLSGKDLALRVIMRLEVDRFEQLFGLPRSPELTYAELARRLQSE